MQKSIEDLSDMARAIWRAGVNAVNADLLVKRAIRVEGDQLVCGDLAWDASRGNICVVGGGKAGAGMVSGLESALGDNLLSRTQGWINVPADCVRPTQRVHLHPARPAGVNEPTAAAQQGTEQILSLVSQLRPEDLCIVLISGGGSALLPAPSPGISLEDKQQVTRLLMRSGATIQELNAVRRPLSRIKGGGLLRACRAGHVIALIISDVIGDPLDVIASGPTVRSSTTARDALGVLEKFDPHRRSTPLSVTRLLEGMSQQPPPEHCCPGPSVINRVIGNNQTAVRAAAAHARSIGVKVLFEEFDRAGVARELGEEFAAWALEQRELGESDRLVCLISGGEPIVDLNSTSSPGLGGRNQELVLAATAKLWEQGAAGICVLSGGTDGEDGPTNAAGACVDQHIISRANNLQLHPLPFLQSHNSYPFFEQTNGHLLTGPTHTNVMDLRVVLARPKLANSHFADHPAAAD